MSTFNGIVPEFPGIRIDRFTQIEGHSPPLACFLSHVHSDHLGGLLNYRSPFIYCSAATRQMLLRLEKWPHRMNFARGILESRKQTYKKLGKLLRIIPLNTPTEIELSPGYVVHVTLFDANHCTGAVMFLIEGQGKAILYTGDVRSEPWWVDNLIRHPMMLPYAAGAKRLDNIYLDTTFATKEDPHMYFPPKADGLVEMLQKVSRYPDGTVFYFNAWTFGYEECWVALSHYLKSRVHLDDYRYGIYSHIGDTLDCNRLETAPLVGFRFGNTDHQGCLVNESGADVRIHSCERGTKCEVHDRQDVIEIRPIITRHRGIEYGELGAGGGHGDLDQVHELELDDVDTLYELFDLCSRKLTSRPDLLEKVRGWITKGLETGTSSLRLDTTAFLDVVAAAQRPDLKATGRHQADEAHVNLGSSNADEISLDRFVSALEAMFVESEGLEQIERAAKMPPGRLITFPYSRHSSYGELRHLVKVLHPRAVFPNTVMPGLDMEALFGDLLIDEPTTLRMNRACADATTQTSPSRAQPAQRVPTERTESIGSRLGKTGFGGSHSTSATGFLREATDAALGLNGKIWGTDIEITSVSGYHNAEKEVEL